VAAVEIEMIALVIGLWRLISKDLSHDGRSKGSPASGFRT